MDKVDAKTRETAATLLDVLSTSKSPTCSNDSMTTTVMGKPGLLSTIPISTIRHGFGANGWGDNKTVQNQDMASNPQKEEHVDQKILHQHHLPPTSAKEGSAPSFASFTTTVVDEKQKHQLQHRTNEKQLEQEGLIDQPSKKARKNDLLGKNGTGIASSIDMNTTIPTTISMTSIGFGIDNNNKSRIDATEAAVKAVVDAMERSALRFQTSHSHSLQIRIQLGVPSARVQANAMYNSDPNLKCFQPKLQTMKVDFARLSNVLPRVIPILPVQVEVGGLYIPGGISGTSSICAVVACITLESQPQSSPQTSIAHSLPPCSSLPLENSTEGLGKLTMTSTVASNPVAATNQNQQTTNCQSRSGVTVQDTHPNGISPDNNHGTIRIVSEENSRNSSSQKESKLINSQISNPKQIYPEMASPVSTLSNMNDTTSGNTSSAIQPRNQKTKDDTKQRASTMTACSGNNPTTNSIEILAMISEQEIYRRNKLGANRTSISEFSSSTPSVPTSSTIELANSANTGSIATPHNNNTNAGDNFKGENGKICNTSNSSTMGTSIMKLPGTLRQPPHFSRKQNNKTDRCRGKGKTIAYFDYSNELPLPEERDCWALSTRTTSSPVFPLKLHETLTQIENDGYDDIIGWLPHGRSFKIHKQKEFTEIILPRYVIRIFV